MIPYILYKHFGYESKVACYKNGAYPYLNKEVKGLKVDFVRKYTGSLGVDGLIYLMKNGCFIISSDILPSTDIINNKKYGDIFSIDNTQQLAECLIKACNDELQLEKVCNEIQDFAYKQFYWVDICEKIDILISDN